MKLRGKDGDMSELTPCNYCTLKRLKLSAKETGNRVVVKQSKKKVIVGMPGFDVYVLPNRSNLTESNKKQYWICWFGDLTDHCVC